MLCGDIEFKDRPFLDLEHYVEDYLNKDVPEIFEKFKNPLTSVDRFSNFLKCFGDVWTHIMKFGRMFFSIAKWLINCFFGFCSDLATDFANLWIEYHRQNPDEYQLYAAMHKNELMFPSREFVHILDAPKTPKYSFHFTGFGTSMAGLMPGRIALVSLHVIRKFYTEFHSRFVRINRHYWHLKNAVFFFWQQWHVLWNCNFMANFLCKKSRCRCWIWWSRSYFCEYQHSFLCPKTQNNVFLCLYP